MTPNQALQIMHVALEQHATMNGPQRDQCREAARTLDAFIVEHTAPKPNRATTQKPVEMPFGDPAPEQSDD